MVDFVVIKDCRSLFQRRNNSPNIKTDHLDNNNNDISRLIFADINMFPGSDTGDDNSHIDYNDKMTEANNNNEHTIIESYYYNNNDNNNDDNYDITDVYDNTEYCMSDTSYYLGLYRSASGVDIRTLCMIEGACNNHALKYDDVIDSIKVNDNVIHCTKTNDAFITYYNTFVKGETYSNNNNIITI